MQNISRTKTDKVLDVVVFILVAIIILIILYPLLFVVSASFSDARSLYDNPILILPRDFNIKSYERVFENQSIWIGYRNTLIYTVAGTFINIAMTILAAYPLSRRTLPGRNLIGALFIFTMFFSGGLIPTYLVVKQLKMINTIWALIIPGAISVYNMIVMRTYFATRIPEELEESGKLDGCSSLMLLFKIVLPLSTPIIAVMTLFYGVAHWNSYFQALIYTANRNLYPLQLVLRELLLRGQMESMLTVATEAEYSDRMMAQEGLKYAVVVVSSIPMMVLYPLLQRFFKEGILVGALKG